MPGFPVHHQLPELTQTHVHRGSDAIQPSHPVVPFSFRLQSLPASESFPVSQFFASGGQSIGSFSLSISPSSEYSGLTNILQDGLVGSPRDSQKSSPTPQFKSINYSALSFLYSPTLTSIHTTGKTIALTRWAFVDKVTSLLFNMLSRLVITFLPRSQRLSSKLPLHVHTTYFRTLQALYKLLSVFETPSF